MVYGRRFSPENAQSGTPRLFLCKNLLSLASQAMVKWCRYVYPNKNRLKHWILWNMFDKEERSRSQVAPREWWVLERL